TGVDKLDDKISDRFNSLGNNISDVKERIEYLNSSLDKLKEENNSSNIESELNKVKNLSFKITEEVSLLKTSVADLFEEIGALNNNEREEADRQRLDQAVERIENVLNGTKPDFKELKGLSGNLSEKIDALSSDFSGLSEKTVDKLDKFFAISRNLESKLDNSYLNTDEVMDLIRKTSELNENQINITNEVFDKIRKDFSSMGVNLSGFNNDFTDINSKINKLIISANENAGALKDNINKSFDGLKDDLKRNQELNSQNLNKLNKNQTETLSVELGKIYQKVENVNALSLKGLNSSGVLREAIMQMAEWIDSAGKLLEENNENTRKNLVNMNTVAKTVSDSGSNVLEQVNRVYKKFEDVEIRLESIEARIERLKYSGADDDLKPLLAAVKEKLSQPASKNNENNLVLNKIDKLETQMVLFETKIQKILDFIEEE
ncbi:MAG TPA: hypothetical protein P5556_03600, partial [Candidatus Gastranaerophilales bacterium]|nr:hypothetical protein [Candidatus Gastranaerophilales bacterium]